MLNQTNIGHNNNKFYVIQVILSDSQYYCWTRWGRVVRFEMICLQVANSIILSLTIINHFFPLYCQGESGQSNLSKLPNAESSVKMFEKKFKEKTKNNWSDRDNFQSHPGKYTLIEVDGDEDAEVKVTEPSGKPRESCHVTGNRKKGSYRWICTKNGKKK